VRCWLLQHNKLLWQFAISALYYIVTVVCATMFFHCRNIFFKLAIAVLLICSQIQAGYSFVPHRSAASTTPVSRPWTSQWRPDSTVYTRQVQPLFQSSNPNSVDGTGRGLYIFAAVLGVCVWLFSIPPEFRRAHFCAVERCVQNRAKCYDCVTFSEWKDGVSEYYESGGGVQFDFTVAEETKEFWKDAVTK
jgi:hypothetical protein